VYSKSRASPFDRSISVRQPKVGTPAPCDALLRSSGALTSVSMTGLQQAIAHGVNVVVVIVAVVVLACTGNLSTEAVTVILAVGGFGGIGIAAVTQTDATPPAPVAPAVPVKVVTQPPAT
jgi:hypothetical protein